MDFSKANNIRQPSMLYVIQQKSARAAVATNNILAYIKTAPDTEKIYDFRFDITRS